MASGVRSMLIVPIKSARRGELPRSHRCYTQVTSRTSHPRCPDNPRTVCLTQCSKNCGVGVKSREVQCFDMRDQRPLRPFHCRATSSRPQAQLPCNPQPCLDWYASSWGQVSQRYTNEPGSFWRGWTLAGFLKARPLTTRWLTARSNLDAVAQMKFRTGQLYLDIELKWLTDSIRK